VTALDKAKIQAEFKARMDEDELLNCMRCGFCLPSCPTYVQSGNREAYSPRGRIALMKAVADGRIEPDEDIERTLNECLGCRACEPVCPSGVRYGHLLEEARDIINRNKKYSLPARAVRSLVFKHLFPHPKRMRRMTALLGVYQRTGLARLVRKTKLLNLLPQPLAAMERALPQAPTLREMSRPHAPVRARGTARATVGFFSGCLMDTMFRETNIATMKLLEKAGCNIVVPGTQNCCGALHGHAGEKSGAVELAKRNIEAFESADVDYIVTNAGGCGAYLADYGHLLRDDPAWAGRAASFSAKIKDISAILFELGFHESGLRLPPQVVTYQDSCHLRNVQRTSEQPRKLLRAIEGVDYREMEQADRCCGLAGIYNLVHADLSMKFLDDKMARVRETQATTIVTANPGCLLQMKLGVEREGLSGRVRVVHIADFLLEAMDNRQDASGSGGV
jgi:glycolate oxidase iron-sulfur subunit